ncbi:hypothetical protein C174_28846 [Bacillus mycoides FSL H7-687]|nr:hypothetical protein C174_28846 [Bacillus mycoides FSL H7-687]
MSIYKRFSLIMFLVLFLSLFISTTMKFHFIVGILWILCTCTLFLYVPLRFQHEVPAFQKYVDWIKSGGRWGSKIYQRFFDYIYRSSKYINDSKRNIDLPTS